MNRGILGDDFFKVGWPLALYGAGRAAAECLDYLESLSLSNRVEFLVDNDPNRWGSSVKGRPVGPPELLGPKQAVVICAPSYVGEIYQSLNAAGHSMKTFVYDPTIRAFADIPRRLSEPGRPPETEADLPHLRELYQDDQTTGDLLAAAVFIRCHPGAAIQPYNNFMEFSRRCITAEDYWLDPGLDSGDQVFTLLDVGAYRGESFVGLISRYGDRLKKIYAFEPDPVNFSHLRASLKNRPWKDRVDCRCLAAGDRKEILSFKSDGCGSRLSSEGDGRTEVRRLDDLDLEIEGQLLIKMDVEGAELSALRGAAGLIEKYGPQLAVCLYHRYGDLGEIPACLKSLNPAYRCLIRGGLHAVCQARLS